MMKRFYVSDCHNIRLSKGFFFLEKNVFSFIPYSKSLIFMKLSLFFRSSFSPRGGDGIGGFRLPLTSALSLKQIIWILESVWTILFEKSTKLHQHVSTSVDSLKKKRDQHVSRVAISLDRLFRFPESATFHVLSH